jgi:hypothetical protein
MEENKIMHSINWILMPIGANFGTGSRIACFLNLFLFMITMTINVTLTGKLMHFILLSNNNKSQKEVIKSSSCMMFPLMTASVNQILMFRRRNDMILMQQQLTNKIVLHPEMGRRRSGRLVVHLFILMFVCSSAVIAIVGISSADSRMRMFCVILWDVRIMQTMHEVVIILLLMTYVPFVLTSGIIIGSLTYLQHFLLLDQLHDSVIRVIGESEEKASKRCIDEHRNADRSFLCDFLLVSRFRKRFDCLFQFLPFLWFTSIFLQFQIIIIHIQASSMSQELESVIGIAMNSSFSLAVIYIVNRIRVDQMAKQSALAHKLEMSQTLHTCSGFRSILIHELRKEIPKLSADHYFTVDFDFITTFAEVLARTAVLTLDIKALLS